MFGLLGNVRGSIAAAILMAFSYIASPAQAGPYEIGKAANEAGDYAVALQYWKPAAEQGDPASQNGLAVLYYHGHGVPQDLAEYLKWLRRSADQGFAKAQANLALFLIDGGAGERDEAEALRYAVAAAEQGDMYGQYALGYLLYRSRGDATDYEKAVDILTRSASQGFHRAQALLGDLYAFGLGTPENHTLAFVWYRAAMSTRPPGSLTTAAEVQGQIDRLMQRSSNEDINAGQVLAERCIASHYLDCGLE